MEMSVSEKIRVLAKRKSLSIGELAEISGQSRQNLSNKLSRDNFTVKELETIAAALNCAVEITFTEKE